MAFNNFAIALAVDTLIRDDGGSAAPSSQYCTPNVTHFIRTVYQNALGRQPNTATLNLYLASFSVPAQRF